MYDENAVHLQWRNSQSGSWTMRSLKLQVAQLGVGHWIGELMNNLSGADGGEGREHE
jgi:hypothetical protein